MEHLSHLQRRERGLYRKDQRGGGRDQWRREARAERRLEAVGVDRADRRGCTGVGCRQNRIQTGRAGRDIDAVPAGRADGDVEPEIGEPDFGAGMAQRGHGNDAAAICRRAEGVASRIAGGSHDNRADGRDLAYRVGIAGVARPHCAQAHVDHPRRVRIGGHARHRQTGGPAHAGDDVGIVAAAFAEHAHGQHAQIGPDAGHADSVIRDRGDDAGDLRAMPRAILGRVLPGARIQHCASIKKTEVIVGLGSRDPVAGVGRIGIAAIAVVSHADIADHVVTRQQLAPFRRGEKVGMLETHTGIEVGDDHIRVSERDVPRGFDIDRRRHGAARRPQVPLTDGGAGSGDAVGVQRVIGRREEASALVGHCVFDIGLARQALCQLDRRDAAGEDHLCALGDGRAVVHRHTQPTAERLGVTELLRGTRERLGQQGRVGSELDDHARSAARGRGPIGLCLNLQRDCCEECRAQRSQVHQDLAHRNHLCGKGTRVYAKDDDWNISGGTGVVGCETQA